MHFWLTSAIQILSDNMTCHTTYRRTDLLFTAKLNHIVRFGFFASSSFKTTLTQFGTKTCFEIKTCSGAFLGNYSDLGTEEEEVLIPPYELFMVVKGPRVKAEYGQRPPCFCGEAVTDRRVWSLNDPHIETLLRRLLI
ncbi:T-cell ecto-ADP-ribosyltransferase 1-like isoform X1 [Lates japonicus]|uniref:NAD(P)(+)--arginine ADP-ribosyltransferase n=1 Tax=Lates japonicus TaxID=270547 RepID=A0AAD3NFA0_LATJO|nr:T-cell ecto-ADP-ribosyltransferase 1-like isoform X1 [Lates japonicus]